MKIYKLEKTQILPISLEKSWEFFSDPENLKLITPPGLGLEITSDSPDEIYEGMIISYNVRPFPFYRTKWLTEITHVKKPTYFVDEQRIGPYNLWHHKHFFNAKGDNTEICDVVHYSVPYGPIGEFLHSIYIERNLEYIFNYRSDILNKMFGNGKHYDRSG